MNEEQGGGIVYLIPPSKGPKICTKCQKNILSDEWNTKDVLQLVRDMTDGSKDIIFCAVCSREFASFLGVEVITN